MAKEQILLREAVHAVLAAKGDELTWAELDANFVEVYAALVALSKSSGVAAYSNAVTYDDTVKRYVEHADQLWKFINATPAMDVTPGTDPLTWIPVYASDLVHDVNKDTYLDKGGSNEVTAAALKTLVTAFGGGTGAAFVKTAKITLTPAQINTGQSAEVDLIAAVNNKYIDIIDIVVDWNLSTGMDVGAELHVKFSGASSGLFILTGLNALATRKRFRMVPRDYTGASANQYIDSTKVVAAIDADSTTAAGTGVTLFINYIERAL